MLVIQKLPAKAKGINLMIDRVQVMLTNAKNRVKNLQAKLKKYKKQKTTANET